MTLNPALDLTYTVDALVPHGTHRVAAVAERPGGKGLNVAGVLHALGEPVLATGLLGGATGDRVATLLAEQGVPAAFEPIAGETRRTVAVTDRQDATGFWEPGPRIGTGEWAAFAARFRGLLAGADVVTLSGSLPPGVPEDGYAVLIRLAARAGVPTVLDTGGEALRRGLAAGPDLAKPNAHELAALVPGGRPADVLAHGARAVVVSRGPEGLHAQSPEGAWQGIPAAPLTGNPTGAGDACVAALARGLRDRTPWPELVADAVALSAAAVAAPVAGTVDPGLYRRMLPGVTVTDLRTAA
ncbi:1-phosphofructokinase family hexose kinase [Pseudosporangium ferrugineum]|uniref:1-phosphofructokinase family hexose kinase n=1 Tax=Pseudosporangium ferrugineum TaxID=439699 RepID=UPI001FE64476|nr:1-phosphofructokinase family hexose kinase [Pseudosporangium ferrugineum]